MDQCVHIKNAIDLIELKKVLDNPKFTKQCDDCTIPSDHEGIVTIWMCLKCGHQGCNRYWNQHALKHVLDFESHSICVDINNWSLWCYTCDDEINVEYKDSLRPCISFIRNHSIFNKEYETLSIEKTKKNEERQRGKDGILNKSSSPPGLKNLGNTCFFNSAMQCLGQTPFLLELLIETLHSENNISDPEEWGPISNALANTLNELKSCRSEHYDPDVLFTRFCRRVPRFRGYRQQDSHELIRNLLEVVGEEILKKYKMLNVERVPPAEQVFGGTLISTLQCQECMHTSQRREFFLDLSVPISKVTDDNDLEFSELSVQSCLTRYTSRELLTDANRVVCDECTKRSGNLKKKLYRDTTKEMLICNPPAVLIVHLNRFELSGYFPRKIDDFVSFPTILDFTPFCYESLRSRKVLYSLYGVVSHGGSVCGGHYVSYVKTTVPLEKQHPRWQFLQKSKKRRPEGQENKKGVDDLEVNLDIPSGEWYYISDSYVRKYSESQVLQNQAYLLFYERLF